MYAHLHTHSYYSFLEGLPSPTQLVAAAANAGMPALALTDAGRISGAIEFYDACQAAGMQPILGLEIAVSLPAEIHTATDTKVHTLRENQGILVLLAMDMRGWANLCRLSSVLQTDPDIISQGHLPFEWLSSHQQGLICLTGGRRGLLTASILEGRPELANRLLAQLVEIFDDRLYIELQSATHADRAANSELAARAGKTHISLAATHPIYYLSDNETELQRVVTAMRMNSSLDDLPDSVTAPAGARFLSPAEMAERFTDYPTAIAACQEIAERCTLKLPLGQPHYPELELAGGATPTQMLRQKALAGAKRLYDPITPEIQERLEHELAVITQKGYASLFLIMEDILRFARTADIPSASRGSASSSLVAHCLDITTPDPMQLNLYFERFLNPARSSPPDIDTDLCSRRRDEVIQHVYQTYGAERVAMVATINRFRSRSALREVAKAYGLPAAEIKALAERLPYRGWGPPRFNGAPGESPYAPLEEHYRSARHQAIFANAHALIDVPHHLSIHPGGVVIAPGPLTNLAPTQLSSKGLVITQFDLDSVERLGLVKIDLLGIRGLSVLGDVAARVRQKDSARYVSRLAALDAIPQEDAATAELVQSGHTIGCFQIESPGMRATLREIQASSIDDIMVALALYRPGPLTGGLKDAFVQRHLGQAQVEHMHPAFAPLLADTHGVILYQEQVLRIAHELAGLSLAEADLLRRAMSHFDPGQQMQTLKEKFIAGALAHRGVPPEIGERVWDMMAAFAGYGFPKAHAASYAHVAWRSAWCKAHHPAEFMAAILANWGGYYSQQVYLTQARRLGLSTRAPHVNHSQREFSVQYLSGQPVLFMGLDQVRDLTRRTQRRIIRERPFHSLDDFLARVDPRPVEADNLVQAGAFQGLGTIPQLARLLNKGAWQPRQYSLFSLEAGKNVAEDWSPRQISAAQEAILGVSVDYHPLELVSDELASQGVLTTLDAAAQRGARLRVAGMRQTWRRVRTRAAELIYIMSLEDLEGSLRVIIPSSIYRQNQSAFKDRGPYIIEGLVQIDSGDNEPYLRAEKIWHTG